MKENSKRQARTNLVLLDEPSDSIGGLVVLINVIRVVYQKIPDSIGADLRMYTVKTKRQGGHT